LENKDIKKCGHDLKLIWRKLKNKKINFRGIYFDTMLASYLLNPSQHRHSLDFLSFSELGLEKTNKAELTPKKPQQLNLGLVNFDFQKLSLYLNENADFTNRLVKILKKRLEEQKLWNLFIEIEIPLIAVLGEMENNGLKLEIAPIKILSKKIATRLKTLEKAIYHEAQGEFNINSTKQLKKILFEKLAIPVKGLKKIKTGYSTAENQLEKIKDLHPIIPLLQNYRELNKLQTTYLNALPNLINPQTGRIHSNFNQTITATGRLSSSEPNLQNIPTKTAEGQEIRKSFVAESGFKLLSFDYSQIELRLAAQLSGDKNMIKAFQNGRDIHTETAAKINNLIPEKVTPKMRQEAKAINFGIIYGQGPHGLAQNAGIPYSQAIEFIKKYFSIYPGIKKMMDNSIDEAQKKGYAITLFGRKRPLPEINSDIPFIRHSAERMAINTPLQGTAADIIKIAMIKISDLIREHENEIRLILQIHDELIFEIKTAKLGTYSPLLKNIMENVVKLQIPLIVSRSEGDNWGKLK
jgi:DNA polymerase-1